MESDIDRGEAASAANGSTVRVLGRLVVAGPDGAPRRLTPGIRQLLAALVAAGADGESIDGLAEALWGEELPNGWRASFRMAVSRLRTALALDVAAEGGGRYRLELPIAAVDSWWLREVAIDEERPVSKPDLRRALAGPAFGDTDDSHLIATTRTRCVNDQSVVARRFCDAVDQIDAATAALLVEHQRTVSPFDDELILSIASCLDRSGRTATAARFLDETLRHHQAELGTRSADLVALRSSLGVVPDRSDAAESSATPPAVGSSTTGAAASSPSRIPAMLQHLVDVPCFGREDELESLMSGRSFVITGPLGSGKTRLLAAVAELAAARGDHISHIGAESSRTPYGPFLAEFPELRSGSFVGLDPGEAQVDGGGSAAVRRADTARTLLVVEHLDVLTDADRHWLLIDDIHGFDEASRRLVGFLAAARTARPMTIVATARNDAGQEWLPTFTAGLCRSGFGSIALGPLRPADLEALLGHEAPELTVIARHEVAKTLFARSGGLPAPARSLIGTLDTATLTFGDHDAYQPDVWTGATDDLDHDTIQVGVAAAVLGDTFRVTDAMAVLERPEPEIDAALERLWGRRILVDGTDPGELRFASTWLRKAFLRRAPSFRLADLHARAAALADDVHSRADHEAAAVPRVPAPQAAQSLLASARASMADGSWLDVVDAIRRAIALDVGEPDIETLILQARALDLSGTNGAGPRKVAFRRAVQARRWDLALAAASSGLPEAERPDGDPDRIAMLEEIPVARLDDEQRFERALLLARQCAVNGSPHEARRWMREAEPLATDTPRRVRVELAAWSVGHHVSSAQQGFSDHVIEHATGRDRMRMLHMQAITALETADLDCATALHRAFTDAAVEVGDPAGIWQAKVLDAALAFERGQLSEAKARSRDAEDYGRRHAMQQSTLVRLGQGFCHKLITGEQGDLVERFEAMPASTDASAIAVAARALALVGRGRNDEAWRQAAPTVVDALDRPRGSALVVLAMLAGLVRGAGDADIVERVRDRVVPFADRSLVVGYGIATTGPVHFWLARIANSPAEAEHHLREAVVVADRSRAPTWRVVTRLALVEATGDPRPVDDAVTAATGTDLTPLLP